VAADAVSVMDALGLRSPVVVGHSWGANVTLEVAVRSPHRVAGALLLDGGFASMRERMDWPTARQVLAPPPLYGMHLDDLLARLRELRRGVMPITPELEAVTLSLMRVDGRGRIRPRLSRANHLRILHALWAQDAPALLRRVRVPTLVLATRSRSESPADAAFLDSKRRAAEVVRTMGSPVRFEWIEGIHDVPLQRPRAVANRVRAFAAELG
jgi:pimeloyl-ACP methyl ester carboxylesterase